MGYKIQFTQAFHKQLHALDPTIFRKWQKVGSKFHHNPFDPSLNAEKVSRAPENTYSARLDDNFRLIFHHQKPDTIVLLWVDKHEKAYERARRIFVRSKGESFIVEHESGPTLDGGATQDSAFAPQEPRLFASLTEHDLAELGVPTQAIPRVRSLVDLNDLERLETDVSGEVFDSLLALACPDREPQQLRLIDDEDEFQRLLAGTLQEWMVFLDPEQRSIVNAEFSGPARIKGGAGTGKTAIALHRAVFIARRALTEQRVLFLTFSSTLAAIVSELLRALAPHLPERRIEVRTLHSWAASYLASSGDSPEINHHTRELLSQAVKVTNRIHPGSPIFRLGLSFIEDEIRYVIKGRAIESEEDYLTISRRGRVTPLGIEERRIIYEIFLGYQRLLQPNVDWDDLILLALRKCETIPPPAYASVIVDEVQDFTESGMRLIRLLSGAGPNSLLLIGDGQQQIYKGGYSLKSVGIEIGGRSKVLRRNYRNTKQILTAAQAMMAGGYDDLEEDDEDAAADLELPSRTGNTPLLILEGSPGEELDTTVALASQLVRENRFKPGDLGFLYRTIKPYGPLLSVELEKAGIRCAELTNTTKNAFLDPNVAVRSTFHNAKGLEFKVVFLLGVTEGEMPLIGNLLGQEAEDAARRERRLLYVAMTRARDQLYMTCSRNCPSRFLADIAQFLEIKRGSEIRSVVRERSKAHGTTI